MLASVSVDVISDLLAAISTYDDEGMRKACAPDVVRWLSLTEEETGLEELLATVVRERSVVDHATFSLRQRTDTADGAVLMVTVNGLTKGGASFHIPVCLVVTVAGGLVTRIDEYANLENAGELIKEMFAP